MFSIINRRSIIPFFLSIVLVMVSLACGLISRNSVVNEVQQALIEEAELKLTETAGKLQESEANLEAAETILEEAEQKLEEVQQTLAEAETLLTQEPPVLADDPQPDDDPDNDAVTGTGDYQIGDIIQVRDTTINVLGWEILPEVGYFTPDPGNMYIAVDLVIVNRRDSNMPVSSFLQTAVFDSAGEEYTISFMAQAQAKGGSIDYALVPGERVRGKVGFEVPENSDYFLFEFVPEFLQPEKVTIDLGNEPVTTAIPIELPGEVPLILNDIGDSIDLDSVLLTVNQVSSPEEDSLSKPREGNKFLLVDITLVNNTSEVLEITASFQMYVKDSTGQLFTLDHSVTFAKGVSPDGEHAPGETINGQIGYEVPEDETSFVFVFEGKDWDSDKAFVILILEE